MRTLLLTFAIFLLPFSIIGCGRDARETITLYTSVDQPYAAPIIRDFEQKTGIKVTLVTDAEATKSVGLAERVRAERNNPQCDVFWSNEPFHTINLASEGLIEPYESPAAAEVPKRFRDPQGRWCSVALRARVIGVHGGAGAAVKNLEDLTKPELKDRIAMAKPTAGTTGGHVAALYVLWGDERAKAYFRQLRDNGIKLLGGNGQVAESVGQGTLVAGLTDNDDVAATKRNGGKIEAVLPDHDGIGTLMVPTTVGIVARDHRNDAAAARKLVDHLLSRETEQKLIDAGFAAWSVRGLDSAKVKAMDVDYAKVANIMPRATREATNILEGRE
ncbi:MAG: iron(III) transport system substrate-binding protein [Phycisphaerales bacterium]|jgi:iron(III) transport system substrate-binding protein|nr:iron(III) transport system substrate-binding protein [Phycisphaerales bacterium]